MKVYGELKFTGDGLNKLFKDLDGYDSNDWVRLEQSKGWEQYIVFQYVGKELDNARLYIYYIGSPSEVHVGNIIPTEKDKLDISDYNALLKNFYEKVLLPIEDSYENLKITFENGDFKASDIMTDIALNKLELFCNTANKSTGSHHPLDEERWFDFIIQTVDDGRIIDYETLKDFLMDKDYWGEIKNGLYPGKCAWSEEKASELASEYEMYTNFVSYYKDKKQRGE